MYGMQAVECEHCGEKMHVLPERQPVRRFEREEDRQRQAHIVGADSWLLHRCVIATNG